MKKTKILFVLIATVALCATLAINVFASTTVSGVQVPSVSFSIVRDSDLANVRIGRVMTEPALLASNIAGFQSQYSGNVNESVRSQWRYDSVSDELELYFASNNSNYDAMIFFGTLPAYYNGARQQLLFYPQIGYSVTNDFVIDLPESDYNLFGSSLNFELRGYTVTDDEAVSLFKYGRVDDLVNNDFLSVLTDEEAERSVISYVNVYYDFDDYDSSSIAGPSTFNRFIIPNGNSFAKRELNGNGAFGIRDFNDRVINDDLFFRIQHEYDLGYAKGYDEGKKDGLEEGSGLEDRGMFGFVMTSIEAFFDFPLFDLPNGGHITLGLILGVIVGALVFVWILKLIAGG